MAWLEYSPYTRYTIWGTHYARWPGWSTHHTPGILSGILTMPDGLVGVLTIHQVYYLGYSLYQMAWLEYSPYTRYPICTRGHVWSTHPSRWPISHCQILPFLVWEILTVLGSPLEVCMPETFPGTRNADTELFILGAEVREQWMIYGGPGFLSVIWFGFSPPLTRQHSASCLAVFLFVAGQAFAFLTVWRGEERMWKEPNHTTARKPGPL